MEAKPTPTLVVEEFEPFCKWQRKEDRDILEIHIQEFKKEQLKVQISNLGFLKISGERPLDDSRKCRFYKEVPIPKNCDSNGIRAKFLNGCLYIVMPKTFTTSEKTEAAESTREDQAKKQPQNGSDKDLDSNGKQETSADAKPAENTPTVSEFQPQKRAVRRLRTFGKVVVTLAALAALIAYIVYMYRSMTSEVVEYF
ncbi:hypothetical protein Fot_07704 [Forsythia ovata]|uniref:SHSP domain-containing protein n=1 Tax=Forsythia ovata TaxID=205694 RepID=A0ABD1WWC4_9LAMI